MQTLYKQLLGIYMKFKDKFLKYLPMITSYLLIIS